MRNLVSALTSAFGSTSPVARKANLRLERLEERAVPDASPALMVVGSAAQISVASNQTHADYGPSAVQQTSTTAQTTVTDVSSISQGSYGDTQYVSADSRHDVASLNVQKTEAWRGDTYTFQLTAGRDDSDARTGFYMEVRPDGSNTFVGWASKDVTNESKQASGGYDSWGGWENGKVGQAIDSSYSNLVLDVGSDGLASISASQSRYGSFNTIAYGKYNENDGSQYNYVDTTSSWAASSSGTQLQEFEDGQTFTVWMDKTSGADRTSNDQYNDTDGTYYAWGSSSGNWSGVSSTNQVDFYNDDVVSQDLFVSSSGSYSNSHNEVWRNDGTGSSDYASDSDDAASAGYSLVSNKGRGPRQDLWGNYLFGLEFGIPDPLAHNPLDPYYIV